MSEHYTELYKKYRPRVWSDIIGQDQVIKSIQQSALSNTTPTGYMFFGPHGCGKTSTAFVLAKTMNCENVTKDGDPCNQCATCKAIDKNTQIGVQYISMANRGSVDDIRKMVNEAQLAQPIKHQVLILDECHNLSKAAFDALLIPLESEKSKSLFIFCSTEPDKIPKTILSRIQTRTFNPVDMKTLAFNLKKISDAENLNVTKEQLISAVRSANGSVRDSVRNLETIISGGELPEAYSEKVLNLITSRKFTDIYNLTNEMQASGQNFTKTTERLYEDLSKVLIIQAGAEPASIAPEINEVAKALTPSLVMNYLTVLGDTITLMSRNTVNSRILFDVAMSKIVTLRRKAKEI